MKKGISLVALIVTIIVLIILTGAVILSFQDGGIIDRADQAVKDSNDAVLEEKITMMNLEYTQKMKKKFTPETRELLKAIVKQSGIDLDKLMVYYQPMDEKQIVLYKIDKVTKSEVEWFLENPINGEKIYFLFGDVNFDEELDFIDRDILKKFDNDEDTPELPIDNWEYSILIGDIRGEDDIDSMTILEINEIIRGQKEFMSSNVDLSVKEQQIKTYFGIE